MRTRVPFEYRGLAGGTLEPNTQSHTGTRVHGVPLEEHLKATLSRTRALKHSPIQRISFLLLFP